MTARSITSRRSWVGQQPSTPTMDPHFTGYDIRQTLRHASHSGRVAPQSPIRRPVGLVERTVRVVASQLLQVGVPKRARTRGSRGATDCRRRISGNVAEDNPPPLPSLPLAMPTRPSRNTQISMIRCGIIDDGAKHRSARGRHMIRSGQDTYLKIWWGEQQGLTGYYHMFVAQDRSAIAQRNIWFVEDFLLVGLDNHVEHAWQAHEAWWNEAIEQYRT